MEQKLADLITLDDVKEFFALIGYEWNYKYYQNNNSYQKAHNFKELVNFPMVKNYLLATNGRSVNLNAYITPYVFTIYESIPDQQSSKLKPTENYSAMWLRFLKEKYEERFMQLFLIKTKTEDFNELCK